MFVCLCVCVCMMMCVCVCVCRQTAPALQAAFVTPRPQRRTTKVEFYSTRQGHGPIYIYIYKTQTENYESGILQCNARSWTCMLICMYMYSIYICTYMYSYLYVCMYVYFHPPTHPHTYTNTGHGYAPGRDLLWRACILLLI